MHKITFIYCFKDRELLRVKLSLESLAAQTDRNFNVLFVDYGSQIDFANEVRNFVESFSFAKYIYNDTRGMVWNRSHALNTAIRIAESPFIFTADIDMIFKPGFVEMLNRIANPGDTHFFSAIMLPDGVLPGDAAKEATYVRTTSVALGWGLIPRQPLIEMGSYDELYCIWGIEDNDIGHRLKLAGIRFNYISDIWMFHYYHPPVPKQREVLPEDWYGFLRDYFNSCKDQLLRNTGIEWGKQFQTDIRVAFRTLMDTSVQPMHIEGRSRFFRFRLENLLRSAASGEIIKAVFTDNVSQEFKNSRLSKWISAGNSVLGKLKMPVKLSSDYESRFEDVYVARNEFMYLVITNSVQLSDYAFDIRDNTLTVVLVKK